MRRQRETRRERLVEAAWEARQALRAERTREAAETWAAALAALVIYDEEQEATT